MGGLLLIQELIVQQMTMVKDPVSQIQFKEGKKI
jgi:hypothetical protein